ncbi:FKBP12-rapamycin complex-associated protein [Fusarium oxysporum f. sp. albedinis]|nr:FKBP12-rapamycin complex-associated protein [Fusarium oxysporum f. sp. albedinis]
MMDQPIITIEQPPLIHSQDAEFYPVWCWPALLKPNLTRDVYLRETKAPSPKYQTDLDTISKKSKEAFMH